MVLNASPDIYSLALVALLIIAFVVAFKVMEMVFETIIASVISAVFYLGLVYIFGFELGIERVLLYAFLGASLYMIYSFLITAYGITSKLLEVPYRLLKMVVITPYRGAKKLVAHLRKKRKLEKLKSSEDYSPDKDRDVKETVLDKVRNNDD